MFLEVIYIILGFILLIVGADLLIKGCSNIAKKFHIPQVLIGLTIVCIGTSLPELIVTISSSLKGHSDLIIGNAIGSNICNLLLILGFISILKPIKLDKEMVKFHIPISILCTLVILAMSLGIIGSPNLISKPEGIILLILFALYFLYPIIIEAKDIIFTYKENKSKHKTISNKSIILSMIYIILGIILLKFGGDFVVDSSTSIAYMFNISERIIGLTVIALGTALPELVTSIVAVVKKDEGLAIGNLIGSCMLNFWLILGIGALINPITFSSEFLINIILLLVTNLLIFIFCFTGKKYNISRPKGIILTVIFILYVISIFINS